MNHEELCRLNNEIDRQARDENRRYRTLKENAEKRHADIVRAENERYQAECRKLRVEHETVMDDINSRKDECRIGFAIERDKLEKSTL